MSSRPTYRVPVKYSGNNLEGQELDSASAFSTDAINIDGASRLGLFINIASEDVTDATVDVALWFSPDAGTTYVVLPATANSQTGAALAQFTAPGSGYEWWEVCVEGEFTRVKAIITQGVVTASEGITYGPCYWIVSQAP
jgi:hypothetical protein